MKYNNKFITRGISKETGEFVYGYYIKLGISDIKHYIIEENNLEIVNTSARNLNLSFEDWLTEITQEPDRWTGLTGLFDNINKKLWENDIVKYKRFNGDKDHIGNIRKSSRGYVVNRDDNLGYFNLDVLVYIKVIGNIHFNKKILEENNDK
jgi:hypothetical protein